jgi:MFS family permease
MKVLSAGVGALAFGILPAIAVVLANPPGGTYSASDASDYVAKGHRASVIIALYLVVLAVVGLVVFLARLRELIPADGRLASIFWGLGIAAAAAFISGYALVSAMPLAIAFGGDGVTTTPTQTYILSEAGLAIMYGAGGTLLGCALIAFGLARAAVPAWYRWFTVVAGICGFAALAWFPFFVVLIWAIASGIWLVAGSRSEAPVRQAQAA